MKRFSILLLLAILAPTWIYSGGWTQKKGDYYLKFSLNNFSTREQFNLRGSREPLNTQFNLRNTEFTDANLSFYGEYGLAEGWTLIANTALKNYNSTGFNALIQQDFDNKASGLGDLYIGSRLCLAHPAGGAGVAADGETADGLERQSDSIGHRQGRR